MDIAERELGAVLVIFRAERIVVRVERHARRQHSVLDRVRAAGLLAYLGGVKIRSEVPTSQASGAAIQHVRAIETGAIAREFVPVPVDQQRLLPDRVAGGHWKCKRHMRAAAAANPDLDVRRTFARCVVDDVDDADKTGGAVADRRGTLQHLDAFDVGKIKTRQRRRESALGRHAVDHQQEGVEFAQTP